MTRRGVLILAVLIVTLFRSVTASGCPDSAACLREIGEAQRQVRSLSARFVQTKHLALLDQPIRSTGTFGFKRPDQVLWKIDDPAFEVRIDGSKVQLPPGEDMGMRAMPPGLDSLLRAMSAVFTGDIEAAARRFELEAHQKDDGIVVGMSPKEAADRRLLGNLRLTFVRPDLTLRAIHLEEAVGDWLEIDFRDVHRNDATAEAALGKP
jgi:outer membrane lipoprotein-sorting protein